MYGIFNSYGTVTVTGGTILATASSSPGIFNGSGTITIGEKDGEVSTESPKISGSNNGIYSPANGTINFYDGIIEGAEDQSIYGDITDIEEDSNVQKYKNGESEEFEVESGREIAILKQYEIAIVNSTGKIYSSLAKALQNSADEDTITLLSNTTVNELEIPSEKDITLDLAGYTITADNDNLFINNGKLTIKDSSESQIGVLNTPTYINSEENASLIKNNEEGTLKIESGAISCNRVNSSLPVISNYGKLEIIGGTITKKNTTSYVINNNGEVEMSGGTITAPLHGIYNIDEGKIKMTGGTIIANARGIYNEGTGSIEVTGGTITSSHGIYNNETGTIEVTRGTITGTIVGIYNNGTITIGEKDGEVNTESPRISGRSLGISNNGTFNFYDGIIEGAEDQSIYGDITDIEENCYIQKYKNGESEEYEVESGREIAILKQNEANISDEEMVSDSENLVLENNTYYNSIRSIMIKNMYEKNSETQENTDEETNVAYEMVRASSRNFAMPSIISSNVALSKSPKMTASTTEWTNENVVITLEADIIPVLNLYVEDTIPPSSYTVNYLEKDTNTVLQEAKVVENVEIDSIVNSADEVIDITGYDYDSSNAENITIVADENSNVINLYYVKAEFGYTVEYYYDDVKDDSKTVTSTADYLSEINTYEDKVIEDYELEKTENLPLTISTNTEENVIKVYYKQTISQVTIKCLDKITGEEIDEEIVKGKIGEEYTVSAKEIEGYTVVEVPEELTGTYTNEAQEKSFYYAKNATVKVKYLEKDNTPDDISDNLSLADEETISGYEGKEYETSSKEIENYELLEIPENATGTMQVTLNDDDTINAETIVIYYYLQKTKVTVNYIDIISNDVLDTETTEGLVGDAYTSKAKDFEGYVLVEKDSEGNSMLPENAEGTMTKDEIVVNYYYKHISAGVIEKHIDKVSGEILDNTVYEGNEGDPYETSSKEFEGYDLVEKDSEGNSMLPENATGTMTQDLIEVKYYYIRKATVKVQYIDIKSNEEVVEAGVIVEADVISGHEGDEYAVAAKDIEGYVLVETDSEGNNLLPTNANGTMQVTLNDDGTANTETIVTYYYARESAGVVIKYINIKTDEILDETVLAGKEGDKYSTSAKEFEGYDLVEEDSEGNSLLPTNAEGTMTQELIEVKYYYIRKATVRVQYVDNSTGEKVSEDLIINGYEDDYYKAELKEIENYTLLETDAEGNNKLPANAEGTMRVTANEDGTVETEIVVTYYYEKVKEPESPVEPDDNTNTNTTNTIDTNTINTNNTNTNNTNTNNTNTNNTNNSTNNNSNNNSNASSNNNKEVTIIEKYIQNSSTNNNSNNNANNTSNSTQTTKVLPSTGDVLPVVAIGTIILVIIANLVQVIISRIKKK